MDLSKSTLSLLELVCLSCCRRFLSVSISGRDLYLPLSVKADWYLLMWLGTKPFLAPLPKVLLVLSTLEKLKYGPESSVFPTVF